MSKAKAIQRRGTPLAMLFVLLGGWIGLRVITWDNPFAFPAMAKSPYEDASFAVNRVEHEPTQSARAQPGPQSFAYSQIQPYPQYPQVVAYGGYPYPAYGAPPGAGPYRIYAPQVAHIPRVEDYPGGPLPPRYQPVYPKAAPYYARPIAPRPGAAGYPLAPELRANSQFALGAGFAPAWSLEESAAGAAVSRKREGKRYQATQEARAPFVHATLNARQSRTNRWMLDAYAFYRQGSGALSLTQGPRPIYGASQLAANLQWRAKPSSSHDPRLYARAYHALVPGGESELAAGFSGRPIGDVPLRLYGELRATRNPAISDEGISAQTNLRPAAYAVTELTPQKIPLGFSLEAYGAAGYVAGNAETYFLDGQAAITRSLTRIGKPGKNSALVSIGAGVWGGAQRGAQRVDIGPTLRFDVNIGDIPARVSVDYREQVAGDADPESGVAATVSTRF